MGRDTGRRELPAGTASGMPRELLVHLGPATGFTWFSQDFRHRGLGNDGLRSLLSDDLEAGRAWGTRRSARNLGGFRGKATRSGRKSARRWRKRGGNLVIVGQTRPPSRIGVLCRVSGGPAIGWQETGSAVAAWFRRRRQLSRHRGSACVNAALVRPGRSRLQSRQSSCHRRYWINLSS